ncbi:MAG: type transport system permease protein [Thermoanaerobaculia bacterium]|jgi:ABC-type multidrug transport system permease subunit|nr:type transport system permease protein [Thermoanaerobaculia bacterium]
MPEKTRIRPPIVELAVTRTKEFVRESEALFWVFGFPLILALALGFAFREKPPDRVPIAVVAGPNAAQRLAALQKSPVLLPSIMSEQDARDALRRGKVSLLIEGADTVLFRFDATRPDAQSARREADDALQTAAGRRDVVVTREERVHEQGARYIDFLIPGLLGMNLMGTGMWSMGFTIANARMKKLLKRLVATPMRKTDFLLAQFLSRLIWLLIEVTVLVAFGWLVFGVRVNGSILLLAVLCIIGGFSFSGIGLLTASRARTIEAVSGLMNFIMMPMWLCSGVFFSYERFPDSVKPIIRLLPLTLLNDALRAVINDAAGLTQIAGKLALLAAWGLITFMIGLKVFRWQ